MSEEDSADAGSTFDVTVNNETVSVALALARALCPTEVEAMETGGKRVKEAMSGQDESAKAAAAEELQTCMRTLLHALAVKEEARQCDEQ